MFPIRWRSDVLPRGAQVLHRGARRQQHAAATAASLGRGKVLAARVLAAWRVQSTDARAGAEVTGGRNRLL